MTEHPIPDLECRALTKAFADFTAVDNIDFTVPNGSFFSILGPSGCGKTTLLRMLAGFEQASHGDIFIKGKRVNDISPNRRPVNMVFQHLALFPTMTVAENIGYGLRRRKTPSHEIKKKIDEVLARVGLSGSGPKQISQLSGGQKQRIAIARCLVLNPDVLLLDEPLGALDLKLREQMKVELKHLQQEFGTTFVYITHDQSEALVMSDQVAVMNNGQFEQLGTPQDLYYSPSTAFVAKFVGENNQRTGTVTAINGNVVTLKGEGGDIMQANAGSPLSIGQRSDVFVRPEAISIAFPDAKPATADNGFDVAVKEILFDGSRSQLVVDCPQHQTQFSVQLPQTEAFRHVRPGDALFVHWQSQFSRCLPSQK
ncbi:spermidine/putrescine ABC transporter ATP-binding protein [Enterovibrio norvegicus FF-33]|uniref:Spermidine/putrescine ABC transporter ATP-binding protein n=1 Tax=Enterovibrio norvegicus FF-454 TaxID=1185651 RepID=A0A1E5C3J5_9GAMM|nr:ABC transporter ATP-binding protein [Enterovibrio norvegicus]OEE60098.1 spermidine/putrescine ABC transporter ATP-binding protein [Enterovibrio norvegicus FF-454]OEE66353.1 spermidine/putrescine ABC transporter ATP-binding protein [Enterovibrio norvegicus FF-33]OEE75205.1 spermidine/putrescine ABC transporter ATP-binding protein [Enterovibrio norvegicus FF-162]